MHRAHAPLGLALAAVLASTAVAHAGGDVTITLTPDGQQFAADVGLDPAELATRIETRLGELYDTANVDGFLRAFANATSFASRGTGADYAPVFRGAELGATVNIAAAVEGLDPAEDPAAGLAVNLSLVGGLSLARWGHPEITLYGNGFYRKASFAQLDGAITNAGVHGQYHLWYPAADSSALIVQWSGVHVTAGLELSRWAFGAGDRITRDFTVAASSGADVAMTAAGAGRFDLTATSVAVPVEVTTSLRILYFASAYVGGGLTFQGGSADTQISLGGDLTGVRPTDNTTVGIGTATITADGTGAPSKVAYHLLAGVEANLWRAKLVLQTTFVPISGASVGIGLRFRL
ncbi:MAG: hypothetical protein R3B06_13705 [Kofleriaceae bacterium]